jgi:hypothetical protein
MGREWPTTSGAGACSGYAPIVPNVREPRGERNGGGRNSQFAIEVAQGHAELPTHAIWPTLACRPLRKLWSRFLGVTEGVYDLRAEAVPPLVDRRTSSVRCRRTAHLAGLGTPHLKPVVGETFVVGRPRFYPRHGGTV